MNCVKFNVGYEDIISRIPGLFAYGEFDEFDEYKLHKATDSPNGCYGKIVENIKINASLKIDGEIILDNVIKSIVDENGNERIISGIYSYRQIMDCYYQYLNQRDKSPLFFEFVEKGIGKKKIEGFDRKINDLVPEYVYLANARSLYNQYVKLNKMCQFYKNSGEKNTDLCCLCEKFERMGGNRMITILEQMIDEAINVADEYYSYCEFERLPLKINFNICLSSSENDMGMLTPYVEEWEAGKKYYEGDIFHYDGKTYKVKNGREFKGIWNDETLRIEFYDYSEETPKISVDIEEYDINTYDGTNNETNELSGYTDSKLQSLRRYKEYLNLNDETEFPDKGKDWLFFYRKNLVLNVRTLNDNLGNIQHIGSDMTNGNDLYAYGDAITDITVNKSERTITFEYWLDAHLNASYTDYEVDDDGNHIYHFSDFRIDDSVNHGIKYTETYTYDEGVNWMK